MIRPNVKASLQRDALNKNHAIIQGLIQMFATDNSGQVGEYALRENFFNLENYHLNDGKGMEQILMGLINQPAAAFDRESTTEVTNFLFPEDSLTFGTDLIARNIQR